MQQVATRLAELAPPDADASAVADAVAEIVDMPHGTHPFRRHLDPADDGAEVVGAVVDRIRVEFLTRVGLEDVLRPRAPAPR